jgi:hypothetical protein
MFVQLALCDAWLPFVLAQSTDVDAEADTTTAPTDPTGDDCTTCSITVPYTYPLNLYWNSVTTIDIIETRIIIVDAAAGTNSTSVIAATTQGNEDLSTLTDDEAYTFFWSSQVRSLSGTGSTAIQELTIGSDGTPTAIVTGTVPLGDSYTVVTGTIASPTNYLHFGFAAESYLIDLCENSTSLSILELTPSRTVAPYTNPYDVPQTDFEDFVSILPSSVSDCTVETPFYASAVLAISVAHGVTTYQTTTTGVVVNNPGPSPDPDDPDQVDQDSDDQPSNDEPSNDGESSVTSPPNSETTSPATPQPDSQSESRPADDAEPTTTATESSAETTTDPTTKPAPVAAESTTKADDELAPQPQTETVTVGATATSEAPQLTTMVQTFPDMTSTSTMVVTAESPEASGAEESSEGSAGPVTLSTAGAGRALGAWAWFVML